MGLGDSPDLLFGLGDLLGGGDLGGASLLLSTGDLDLLLGGGELEDLLGGDLE